MSALAKNSNQTKDKGAAAGEPKNKKRRVSFNPIAIRRQPSDESGNYEVTCEPIKPSNFPPTAEQIEENLKAEDINYVFLYVLNFWSTKPCGNDVEANMERYADKRAGLEAKNGRGIYRATHEDLLVLCQKLLTQLAAGKQVTLSGKAGKMMVKPVASETADINDVRTLIDYLNMMTVKLEF
jgi:hypothetical protein